MLKDRNIHRDISHFVIDRVALTVGSDNQLAVLQHGWEAGHIHLRIIKNETNATQIIVIIWLLSLFGLFALALDDLFLNSVNGGDMTLEVVVLSEDVAAQRALELALGRVRPHVRQTHDLALEPPGASREGAGVRPGGVVDELVLLERRPVVVREAADVAQHAAVVVELAVRVDDGVDGRAEVALTAAVLLGQVDAVVGHQVRARPKRLAALVTQVLLVGPMHLRVLPQVAQPVERLAAHLARELPQPVLLLHPPLSLVLRFLQAVQLGGVGGHLDELPVGAGVDRLHLDVLVDGHHVLVERLHVFDQRVDPRRFVPAVQALELVPTVTHHPTLHKVC